MQEHRDRHGRCIAIGEMRGVPACWGDPAHGIPMLIDPVQAEEHHEPGPPSPLHLFGKGEGQGVRAREGSRTQRALRLKKFNPD